MKPSYRRRILTVLLSIGKNAGSHLPYVTHAFTPSFCVNVSHVYDCLHCDSQQINDELVFSTADMGSCQSQENQELAARNKAIEKQINQDKRAGSSIVKLLLLGMFSEGYSHHM
ncbi:hypothetical protein Y032_0036g3289 [Ancylostoma ceylanicum]|nr:hypothetical protein Y032_0036g3289 [Ancylostoma ceylanicum]